MISIGSLPCRESSKPERHGTVRSCQVCDVLERFTRSDDKDGCLCFGPLLNFEKILGQVSEARSPSHLLSELLNPRKVIISNDTTLAQTDMFFLESGTASYVSYQGQNASSVFL